MTEQFWQFFSLRSLTLYYQLYAHAQHHGFMIVLKVLGDDVQVKDINDDVAYIKSFQTCTVDPTISIDVFLRHMKVCYSVYAKENPAKYRLNSYLYHVMRESANWHLEKDSYKVHT